MPKFRFLILLLLYSAAVHGSEDAGTLRSLDAIHAAVEDSAARADGFKVEGTVVVPPTELMDEFTVYDGTDYQVMTFGCTPGSVSLQAGDRIRAIGRIIRQVNQPHTPYNYAKAFQIEVLAHLTPPPPLTTTVAQLADWETDGTPIRVTGTVLDVFRDEIDPRFVFAILNSRGECLYLASHYTNDVDRLSVLVGAAVEVTGTFRKIRPGRNRSHLGAHVLVNLPDGVRIVQPSCADPFDAPQLSGSILDIRRATNSDSPWRKVHGTVLAVFKRNRLLLRCGGSTIGVELSSGVVPACGDAIEAVGMPETDFYHLNLSRARWRPCGETTAAVEATNEVTAAFLLSNDRNEPQIRSDYHGRSVRLRGKALHVADDASDGSAVLTLADAGWEIPVVFGNGLVPPADLQPGCTVEVTGVCVLDIDNWRPQLPFPRIRRVMLVTRRPEDVRVITAPPWWTPSKLLYVIGVLLAALAGILVWNILLQRVSDRKSRALAAAKLARRESELKVRERTRLATELHDTIVQNLTGASLELRTAERIHDDDPGEAERQVALALKTIDACRNEVRNCIWDLRSRALDEATMDGAIRRTLAPCVENTELAVRFNVPRERLTDNTAHALICIVRELVLNAIRHGRATRIRVAGCVEDGCLLFSVQDNGCGFDAESAPGVDRGHFGLEGIRERVSALLGTVTVESVRGTGTRVAVRMKMAAEGKQ